MIIVSQNKNMIINFNSTVSTYVIKDYVSEEKGYKAYNINFATKEKINFVLATYKTEERAKEILQEIIDMYKFNRCEAVGQKNAVYRMPED